MRHWLGRVGGLAVAGALLTLSAGCTGSDPAPSPSTTASSLSTTTTPPPATSTSPTTTPSTTPTGSDGIPAAAKAHTPAGAEAFVHYFNDQVSKAWMTPDATLIPLLCETTSKSCKALNDTADLLVKDNQRFDRAPIILKSLNVEGSGPGGSVRLVVQGTQSPAKVVTASGVVAHTVPTKPANQVYYVIWRGTAWQIQTIKAGIPS